jgi:hypothetical protein
MVDDTIQAKAMTMWQKFTENEKTGVRFGMFPANKILEIETEGFEFKDICAALMRCAENDGGMRA